MSSQFHAIGINQSGLLTFPKMNISNEVRMRYQVAKEKPLAWLSLMLIAITIGVVWILPAPVVSGPPPDLHLRAWAALLQGMGGLIVWWDLTVSARAFGRPKISATTFDWVKRLISPHRTVELSANLTAMGSMSGSATGKVRSSIPSDATTEQRIENLERNFSLLDDRLDEAFKQIENARKSADAKIAETVKKHDDSTTELKRRLEDSIVGNYSSLCFGAFWAIVGMLLSAFSQDIARLAAGQLNLACT
jgi:hypothetical protein